MTFNRTLRRLGEEFTRPEYAAARDELHALVAESGARGLELRLDNERDWETVHCWLELERTFGGLPERVLDVGGGNSPLALLLALRGCHVTVLDVDPGAVEGLGQTARAWELGERLVGIHGGTGPWPLDDGAFPAALSISVIEGVLRSKRAGFFAELRRVLGPGGHALLTFDYGAGSRYVSDAPRTPGEVVSQVLEASGLELWGEPFRDLGVDPDLGPPVKALAPTADGFDRRVVEYTFGALHLHRP